MCKKPCRFRTKKVRGRKTLRYIERTYAHHADGTEHYVDNFLKAKAIHAADNIIGKFSHTMFLIGEQMKKFPLTEYETRRLNEALHCFMINFEEPQRMMVHYQRLSTIATLRQITLPNDTVDGWRQLVERLKEYEKNHEKFDALRMKWCTTQDIANSDWIWKWDPLARQIRLLFNKYESPKRIAKRKEINKKLSSNYRNEKVEKTDDYTGVELDLHLARSIRWIDHARRIVDVAND
jgi:hypothetical protein